MASPTGTTGSPAPPRPGRALAVAAAVVGALFLAALACFTPAFQTNDDPTMALVASGTSLSPQPDEHIVFTSVLIGRALKQLYRTAPAVPWYGAYLLAVQLLAHVALLWLVLVAGAGGRAVLGFLVYFGTVGLHFLVDLQFTTTAFLAGQAGALLVLAPPAEPEGAARPWRTWVAAAGIALLTLSSLVRFDSFRLALALAAPAVLLLLGRPRGEGRLGRAVAAVLLAVAVPAALRLFDREWYRRDARWADYLERSALLPELTDYGRAPYDGSTRPLYASLGWSENDAVLLRNWFVVDETVFGTDRIRALLAAAPRLAPDALAGAARRFGRLAREPALWPLALSLPLFGALAAASGRARAWTATALGCLLALAALAALRQAPLHVALPVLAFPAALSVVLGAPRRSSPRARAIRILVGGAALAGVALSVEQRWHESRRARTHNEQLRQSIRELAPRPDQLMVAWGLGFPYEWILPLQDWRYLDGLRLYPLGWLQRSPVSEGTLRAFAVGDLYRALYERSDVFLMGNHPRGTHLLQVFGEEHRGIRVRFEVVRRTSSFVLLRGRLLTGDAPPAASSPP